MSRILLATFVISMLGACTTAESNFKRMSEDELALYNSTVVLEEMVYCFEEVRTGSHIKKKFCSSLADIASALSGSYNQLDAMHQGNNGVRNSRSVGYYPSN